MRRLLIAAVILAGIFDVGAAQANWTIAPPGSEKSKEIKEMDIMDRPNRVLHFYGDAVRMSHRRSDKKAG